MPSILDSIKKHKKFKQLATYALGALDKIVKPPRIGWEVRKPAARPAPTRRRPRRAPAAHRPLPAADLCWRGARPRRRRRGC